MVQILKDKPFGSKNVYKVYPTMFHGWAAARGDLSNEENKKEFVQLSANYRLYSSIKDQIESLLAGFYEIIPKDLVSIVRSFSIVIREHQLT